MRINTHPTGINHLYANTLFMNYFSVTKVSIEVEWKVAVFAFFTEIFIDNEWYSYSVSKKKW